jgi:hypothetical protein
MARRGLTRGHANGILKDAWSSQPPLLPQRVNIKALPIINQFFENFRDKGQIGTEQRGADGLPDAARRLTLNLDRVRR